jgi:hypothetical protein
MCSNFIKINALIKLQSRNIEFGQWFLEPDLGPGAESTWGLIDLGRNDLGPNWFGAGSTWYRRYQGCLVKVVTRAQVRFQKPLPKFDISWLQLYYGSLRRHPRRRAGQYPKLILANSSIFTCTITCPCWSRYMKYRQNKFPKLVKIVTCAKTKFSVNQWLHLYFFFKILEIL